MKRPTTSETARTVLWTLALLAGAAFGALVWLEYDAADIEARVAREWAGSLGFDLAEIPERFPSAGRNEAALGVEEFVGRLRLDDRRTRTVWNQFVSNELIESEGDEIGEPPEPARRFLDAHAADFDAFYREVLAREAPRWETDLSLFTRAPRPNTLAASSLTNALAADALYKAYRGRHREAVTALEAAWKVNSGYRARPDLISQLIASSNDGVVVCVLRKLSDVPPEWADRIVADDRRRALYVAIGVESWALLGEIDAIADIDRISGAGADDRLAAGRWTGRVVTSVLRPYFHYCAAASADESRVVAEGLERRWPGELRVRSLPSSPLWGWNPLAPESLNVSLAHSMIAKYMLLADATQAVLKAKELRRAGAGRSRIASTAVGGASWQYEPGDEPGSFLLLFSRPEAIDVGDWMYRYRTIVWTAHGPGTPAGSGAGEHGTAAR